ncbi:MAG: chloride channel protein, partial [Bacteroidia bacterium]
GIIYLFPDSGITIPLAALVGMSAMFAGASRALLTSIVFAMETTSQSNALLPLLGACLASYFVSFFLMKNTIMTEKIARRGVKTPDSYEPDILEKITVKEVMNEYELFLSKEFIPGKSFFIYDDNSLRIAVETMAKENIDVLDVISKEDKNIIIGSLSYKNIISAYKRDIEEHKKNDPNISLRRKKIKGTNTL